MHERGLKTIAIKSEIAMLRRLFREAFNLPIKRSNTNSYRRNGKYVARGCRLVKV